MSKKTKVIRVDKEFADMLDDIRLFYDKEKNVRVSRTELTSGLKIEIPKNAIIRRRSRKRYEITSNP